MRYNFNFFINMKIIFESNLDYQLQAIKSIVDIFEGQPRDDAFLDITRNFYTSGELFNIPIKAIANKLIISDEQIFNNLQNIQNQNGLNISDKLEGKHFTVEMGTGTGKTYVYLRTIYELNKKYGFKKFVRVVPSIAIREGTLKNLEITFEHFQNLDEKFPSIIMYMITVKFQFYGHLQLIIILIFL